MPVALHASLPVLHIHGPPTLKVASFRLILHPYLVSRTGLGAPLVAARRGKSLFSPAAVLSEGSHPDIDLEEEKKNENVVKDGKAEQAWKESLEKFKEEAIKIKAISEEAYEVYSKKAIEILMETSEKLKIQAAKAKREWAVIANEISEEGKQYIFSAAKKPPDSVRDVVEVYASVDEVKDIASVREFYIGIPYGLFLSVGGFLTFMLTGSIDAIRFGVILGGAILALSVSSLRLWKNGKATPLLLKGQTAIATIIFLRQWLLWWQTGSFSCLFMLMVSFAMVAFYVYRTVVSGQSQSQSIKETSEIESAMSSWK